MLRALVLEERGRAGEGCAAGDLERARRRLARWKAQVPFAGDGLFARRLGRAGLTEQDLLALLAEPEESLAGRVDDSPPGSRASGRPSPVPPWSRVPCPRGAKRARQLGFLHSDRPLMDAAGSGCARASAT